MVDEPLLDDNGRIVAPLLVVDLDGAARPSADGSGRIMVGIAVKPLDQARRLLAGGLDVTFVPPGGVAGPQFVASADPRASAETLLAAAEASPQAALALAGVLRAAPPDVGAALDLESFAYSTLLGGREFARWLRRRGPRQPPPTAPQPPVVADRAGSELRITLNRPERRNAYGREMRDSLVEALGLALLDETVERVILDGAGPSFSSGGDLDEFGTAPDLATAHFVRTRAGAGRLLHLISGRLEARLHGSCVGAGIELPSFAGRAIARPGTTFRLPEVAMGLIPGAGGTVSIPRRIGRWRTFYMAMSGCALDASTALEWRLIDAIEEVPPQATLRPLPKLAGPRRELLKIYAHCTDVATATRVTG
jgi:enoyl-CoA hydratase/carnithine racemase